MLGIGMVAGIGAHRLVAARLAFHRLDGVLAADALHPPTYRRYVAIWHGVGVVLLGTMLILRPSLLLVGVAGQASGLLLAFASRVGPTRWRVAGRARGRAAQAWLRRPQAGVAAALLLLGSLLAARSLNVVMLRAMIGFEAVLFGIVLTIVDDHVIRFMAAAGWSVGRTVLYQARSLGLFVAIGAPSCWIAAGPIGVGLIVAATTLVASGCLLRVLAYRLHARRVADLIVAASIGLLVLAGFSAPLALPVILLAITWRLGRRAAASTWLLA